MIAKLKLLLPVLLVCCLVSSVSAADIQTGFEEWFGHNYEPIGGSIMGLSFGTTASTDVFFADINAKVTGGYDWYSLTSDNAKVSGNGEYFISGDMAAYVLDGDMKISLTGGQLAEEFTVGVSSFFDVTVEAYDVNGIIISGPGTTAVATGLANTKTQPAGNPGVGLQYLTVSSPTLRIAYVLVRSEPGYYMVDNVSAIVPEPAGVLALAMGLTGLVGMVTRKRRK